MNSKHRKTLAAIFENPVDGAIDWARIEALFMAVGCNRSERDGSGVAFEKDGTYVFFHRPHPGREALRYRVKAARAFLEKIGVTS